MDVQRDPAILRRKKIRQYFLAGLVVVGLVAISVAVSRLETAAPRVPENTLWFGTVKRGPMVREVRGAGVLVPEDIRWIPATTSGRVERIVLRPGAQVEPGTVILELSNPDLRQQLGDADLQWQAAVAQLENQRATLQITRLQQQANVADAQSAYAVALADLEANKQLAADGLVAELTIKQKQAVVDQAQNRLDLRKQELAAGIATEASQLAPQEAQVTQQKARFEQLSRQVSELTVRSTMSGQLQVVNIEVGQQVGPGANLARVSDPTRLKAEIRISETQTRDLAIGLPAEIDTRNGVVKGHVSRIDPASQGGTVGVDVTLDGPLPAGARPDLSVDGKVELERLTDVLYVESPAFGQENSTISLFRVDPQTRLATRTPVRLGRRSVQFVEVVEGLAQGDRVVLSDMSQYDGFDRIQLN